MNTIFHSRKSGNHPSAFTLLEMLVAMTLLALLMTSFFTVSNRVWKKWKELQCQQQRAAEVSTLFQKMTHDLRSAVDLPHGFFIDLPTIDPLCRKNLFFLTTASSWKNREDLCGVGYFFVEEKNTPKRYECYCLKTNSSETQEALQEQNLYKLFAKTSPSNLSSCQRIASGILAWNMRPAWFVDGKMSDTSAQSSENSSSSPDLLEISITTGDTPHNPSSQEPLETKTFSTIVALPHAL